METKQMTEYLSEDCITEILCRLPITALVGFKCVCKSWNILISDVCIPRISRASSPLSGLLFRTGNPSNRNEYFMNYVSYSDDDSNYIAADGFVESYSSPLPSENAPYDLLDYCNGLILLASQIVPCYYVCNPATKQYVGIPQNSAQKRVYHSSLAFDPQETSHFKLICFKYLRTNSASHPPLLDIFSSETRTWNRCSLSVEPPVAYGVTWLKRSVYLDGILYKLMKSKHLVHLDIEAKRADAIELPCTDEIDEYGFIGVSKGVLHYANHNGIKMMVWQFDFHCKTDCFWILNHCISIHDLAAKHPAGQNLFAQRDSNVFKPYAIHPTSNIIFLGIPEMIFSYHLDMQKLELFFEAQDDRKIVWGQFFVFAFSCCFIILNDYSRRNWSFSSLYRLPPSPVSIEKRLSSLVRVSRKRVNANQGQASGGSRMRPSFSLDRVTPTNVISITDGQSWRMFRTESDSGGS